MTVKIVKKNSIGVARSIKVLDNKKLIAKLALDEHTILKINHSKVLTFKGFIGKPTTIYVEPNDTIQVQTKTTMTTISVFSPILTTIIGSFIVSSFLSVEPTITYFVSLLIFSIIIALVLLTIAYQVDGIEVKKINTLN